MHRRPPKTRALPPISKPSSTVLRLVRISQLTAILSLVSLSLLTSLLASPVQAASKPRPGPRCLPIATLLAVNSNAPGDTSIPDVGGGQNTSPVNRDLCVIAHVYQVIELHDGTRFLDVCPATVPDADCRFILLSLSMDKEEVGDLRRLGGTDIQLRGTLRPMHGRFGMYITHARQFSGGPEKFRPNPRLLRDFDPESDRLAVRDPNMLPSGHRRSFMNRTLKERANP